jgi:alkylation response protein AidB-like acyl-CoA dehydrogenase
VVRGRVPSYRNLRRDRGRALDLARENVRTKTKGPSGTLLATRHGIQQQIAEAEVELAIARGSLARAGQLIDEYFDAHPVSTQDVGELHEIHLEMQCANIAVKRSAVAVVDRAMNAVGGASYMSGHPLARYWRDVRAGSFMQPFTPVEAYSYIASVALGLPPTYDGRPVS